MRGSLLAAALLLIAAFPGEAGSASEPEITDGTADVTVAGANSCPGGCNSAPKFIDLTQAYVAAQTDTHLVFHINIVGNYNANAYGAAEFSLHFTVGGEAFTAGLFAGRSGTTMGDDAITPTGVADEAGFATDEIFVNVPLAALGSGTLTEFFATSSLDFLDEGEVHFNDRAPDSGMGTDYVIMTAAEEPTTTYANITDLPFSNETTEPVSGVFQYNLTTNETLRVLGEVESGNLTLNVTANGEPIYSWNGTDGFDADLNLTGVCVDESVEVAECAYAFTYTLTDFTGFYGIDVAVPRTMESVNATDAPDEAGAADVNGTEDVAGDPADQESPGVALPVLGVGLLVAIVFRRR